LAGSADDASRGRDRRARDTRRPTGDDKAVPSAIMSAEMSEAPSRAVACLVLAGGVLTVSTASILIRYAQAEGMPSSAIAAWRLALASLVLTPFAIGRARRELAGVGRRWLLLALVSGVALAAHFASWISSLAYTSVASSAALVSTHPLWIAAGAYLLFSERLSALGAAGVALTLAGAALILLSDESAGTGAAPFAGNALALVGAFTVSAYMLVGRALRGGPSVMTYVWVVYCIAAVVLVLAAAASGTAFAGYSTLAYLAVLALALGPQLLGHTALNWSLRHLSATLVAVAVVGEPLGAALLAWLLFGETFATLQLAGFVLTLAGIVACALGEGRRGRGRPTPAA